MIKKYATQLLAVLFFACSFAGLAALTRLQVGG